MNNELLILMLDAIRLEIRNLTLQNMTADATRRGGITDKLLEDVRNESTALRERSNLAANTALGR